MNILLQFSRASAVIYQLGCSQQSMLSLVVVRRRLKQSDCCAFEAVPGYILKALAPKRKKGKYAHRNTDTHPSVIFPVIF